MPMLDWLKQVRLAHHRHVVKNLEDFGVSLVEDFEHVEEKEFDFAIKNSDFSLKTIEIRRGKAEFLKIKAFFTSNEPSKDEEQLRENAERNCARKKAPSLLEQSSNQSLSINSMSTRKLAQNQKIVPSD